MNTICSDLLETYLQENEEAHFRPYTPFPRAADRAAFQSLPKDFREKVLRHAENFLGFSYPAITAADYMRFKRDGNRKDFEDKCFARRKALNSLAEAECVEGQGRFLTDIINGIFALCEESGWQLPAHNSYRRSEPQIILPDAKRPVVDLFAAETGAQLSAIAYLLKDALDEISPLIVKRITDELMQRIIVPYLTEKFWWIGIDESMLNNWTPWCTQNVLLTAFLGDFSDSIRLQVLKRACASLDAFLQGYGEDGCCDEGAQYYHHAGGCLFHAADIINHVTDGAFDSFFRLDKVKNIAAYIMNVHIDDKYYFNFADCSPVAGRAGVSEYLFGKCTGQDNLMAFAAKDYVAGGCSLYADEGLNLYYRMLTLFHVEEMTAYAEQQSARSCPSASGINIYYKSAGLFIAGDGIFSLAAKAGCNADSHNHNDVGSFILYKGGRPLFADIGVETYSQKTFSDRRYEIWTMQSGYHNLPVINGLEQKDGAAYRASSASASFTEQSSSFSMEIAGAYPLCADTSEASSVSGSSREDAPVSYVRSLTLDRQRHKVLLTDTTNAEHTELHFITYEKPLISQGRLVFENLAEVRYQGADLVRMETLPITDERLQTAWDHDLYRIILTMTDTVFSMEIE